MSSQQLANPAGEARLIRRVKVLGQFIDLPKFEVLILVGIQGGIPTLMLHLNVEPGCTQSRPSHGVNGAVTESQDHLMLVHFLSRIVANRVGRLIHPGKMIF